LDFKKFKQDPCSDDQTILKFLNVSLGEKEKDFLSYCVVPMKVHIIISHNRNLDVMQFSVFRGEASTQADALL